MTELTGNTVFMILFNYSDRDYSVIKIMNTLDKAYKYICQRENEQEHYNTKGGYTMVTLNKKDDIDFPYQEHRINVIYVKTGKYLQLDIFNRIDISQYIIVPMEIS